MNNEQRAVLSAVILNALGFQPAGKSTIPRVMRQIQPSGLTAMRDSLLQGNNAMLQLNKALIQAGTNQRWHFVHVILTDGIDNRSTASQQQALQIMTLIGRSLNIKSLKIIFIGVNVTTKTESELRALARAGGENSEYYNVNQNEITSIFNRIELSLGIQRQVSLTGIRTSQTQAVLMRQQVNPVLQVQVKNFAVMFNIDMSQSMEGQRWSSVCQSVEKFISHMSSSDLVAALVFNQSVKNITNIITTKNLEPVTTSKSQTYLEKSYQPLNTNRSTSSQHPKSYNKEKADCCCQIM